MKPILFNTEMVRAILDGRKTMTRRVIKKIPNHMHCGKNIMDWDLSGVGELKEGVLEFSVQSDVDDFYTDYAVASYRPGDILWVRETWLKADDGYCYKADIEVPSESEDLRKAYGYKWKPSVFMPREAARIFLKVTNVRVERVQDISPGDCLDEGVINDVCWKCLCMIGECKPQKDVDVFCGGEDAIIDEFATLWDKLNSKRGYSWESNPWVWVYEFERVSKDGSSKDE